MLKKIAVSDIINYIDNKGVSIKTFRKVWPKSIKIFVALFAIIFLSTIAVFIKLQLPNNNQSLPKSPDAEMVSGVDYVPEEVIALADSSEQAQQMAKEYGVELKSYVNGVAVFLTSNPEEVVKSSGQTLSFNRFYKTYQDSTPEVDTLSINTDNITNLDWYHKEIYTERAWDYSTGEGASVAVIDTGIAINHPAFNGRISDLSYNSHTDQVGKEYVTDDFGHGSHVSGIIASSVWGNENVTVSGVAPDAEILTIKANTTTPMGTGFQSVDLYRGINYAVNNGADIINMSLGRPYFYGPDEVEQQVIQNAVNNGVTVIVSAGNESLGHAGYPASYPEVLAVSATGPNNKFDLRYSNYGPEVDIAAPGTDIYSVDYTSENPIKMTGTSMASPNVAGVAALIVSQNPNYTPAEVRATLLGSAQDAGTLGRDDRYGSGLVSAYAALLDPSEILDATYNLMDSEQDPIIVKVAPGSALIRPEIKIDGQNYHEWYQDQELTLSFDFSRAITEDTALYEGLIQLAEGSWIKEFPDENFRAFAMKEVNAKSELDKVSPSEIEQLSSSKYNTLLLQEKRIKDLTGIKYFSNVKKLNCSYNDLTSLDLSNNSKLLELECILSGLTSVNVSNSSMLRYLYLYNNDISTLDISANIALERLDITMNGMQSTDDVIGWQDIGLVLGDTFMFDAQVVGFYQQPLSPQTNEYGEQLGSLDAWAEGKRGVTGIQYQWYSNTTPSNSGGTLISDATSGSLYNQYWTDKTGTYYYYCVASAEIDGVVVESTASEFAEVTYYRQASLNGSPATNAAFVTSIGGYIYTSINPGDYELNQITIDTLPTPRVLIESVDYEISETNYIFQETFLQSLPLGTYHITFDMVGGGGGGTDPVLNLIVSNERVPISGELSMFANINITMPGKTLNLDPSGIVHYPGAEIEFQWSRSETIDGVFSPIETPSWQSQYTVQESDIGYYIQATATGAGAYTGQVVSNKVFVKELAPILESITVTTPPDKTDYLYGEAFDITGLVITANYDDDSSRVITHYRTDTTPGDILDHYSGAAVMTYIEVSYAEDNTSKSTYFDIRLKPIVPTELTSEVFTINQENNLINGISENMTVDMILDGLKEKPNAAYPFIVFEKSGATLDWYDIVGTGTKALIKDWQAYDGNILKRTYDTIVKGDTDGDGVVAAGDAYDIILHSIDTKRLTGAYLKAANINSNEEVTAGDAYDIILYSIGAKETL